MRGTGEMKTTGNSRFKVRCKVGKGTTTNKGSYHKIITKGRRRGGKKKKLEGAEKKIGERKMRERKMRENASKH